MTLFCFFFLIYRRPPRSKQSRSSAASDVYKRQGNDYYYRVYATGTPGQSTGVYTTLPGNVPVKHCAVTIG